MPATDAPAEPAAAAPRAPGRPRSAEADEAILAATLDLVHEAGIGRLSMDDVAARAGVSKATIYRRWDSKESMILEALKSAVGKVQPIDTGSLRSDLLFFVEAWAERIRNDRTRDLMPHLIAAATSSPSLQAALDEFSEMRTRPLRVAFRRAIERGELPPDTDVTLALDLLIGAIMHRRLFFDGVFADDEGERLVDAVIRAVSAVAPSGRQQRR